MGLFGDLFGGLTSWSGQKLYDQYHSTLAGAANSMNMPTDPDKFASYVAGKEELRVRNAAILSEITRRGYADASKLRFALLQKKTGKTF